MFNPIASCFVSELEALIAKNGLTKYQADLLALAQNCVILAGTEAEQYEKVGNSRLGGIPDVCDKFVWPEGKSFLAQLNLQEVLSFDANHVLPNRGMLYFFLGNDEPSSNLPIDVIWHDVASVSVLKPAKPPEGDSRRPPRP